MRLTSKNEKVTISIIGAGNRAQSYIKALDVHYPNDYKITHIFDPKDSVKEYFINNYGVDKSNVFDSYIDFGKMPRLSDVVIIATPDGVHYEPAIMALEKGYDVILEKPICMNVKETIAIGELGKKYPDQLVAVCHVLRHSPFFRKIKELIRENAIGKIINIQHNENVGYFHYAHSYVRGNWRNTDISAPFIVAKSCHDLDIILYLIGDKHCLNLSSMGSLSFFRKENYDAKKMAPKCSDCSIEDDCPYSALKIYSSDLIRTIVFDKSSKENLIKELNESTYGNCVFASDNNVCDHQVTALEFEDGVHATFNLSAFTEKNHRSIKLMGEYGEIRANESLKEIEVRRFGSPAEVLKPDVSYGGGHGGADEGFMISFMETYLNGKEFNSTLEMSIESHVMAFACEESRLNDGKSIKLVDYYKSNI